MAKRKLTADAYVRPIITANPNMLVPHYLMASFLYYKRDNPIISDKLFDDMSKTLLKQYANIEHYHKHLITEEDLVAGTGFAIVYPTRTAMAAERLAYMHENGELS